MVCFAILFFVITNLFHLPIQGEKNLSTEETGNTGNAVGYISDLQPVKQSLFFHEPVRLHSMDVLAANYGDTVTMPEITYYIMDNAKQTLYSSTIPTSDIIDNTYLHVELGDVKLEANRRYFLCFQGAIENESVICPTFYMMPKDNVSDYLYCGAASVPDMALCASYHYDVVPMGTKWILFFTVLLVLMVAAANFKTDFIRQNIWVIPAGIWLVLWGGMFLSVLFINNPANGWIPHDKAGIFALILLALTVIGVALYQNLSIQKIMRKMGEIVYKYRLFFGLLFFSAIFLLQYMLAGNLYQKIGWDVGTVWDVTTNWMVSEEPQTQNYLMLFPNNIGISLVTYYLRLLVKSSDIAKQYHFVITVNILLLDFGIFMTYQVAKKIWGFSAGVMAMTWVSLLIGFSGWIVVPYTDTMPMWIPVTIFYLFMLAEDENKSNKIRCCSALGVGFLTVWGYFLKPQCVIIDIAIAMVVIYRLLPMKKRKSEWKRYGRGIGVSVAGALAGCLLFSLCEASIMPEDFTRENAVSMSHFFMMGLNENPNAPGFGCYSDEDAAITMSLGTKEEKSEKNWEITKERMEDFGVAGFLNHLYQKGIWILSDGTFFWQHEGSFFVEDYSQNGSEFQRKLREYYYEPSFLPGSDNVKHVNFMGVLEGFWLIIFGLLSMMPLLMGRHMEEKGVILCLSALGCIMFTLLFEGRSRYLILYVPVYAILASSGIHRIIVLIHSCLHSLPKFSCLFQKTDV